MFDWYNQRKLQKQLDKLLIADIDLQQDYNKLPVTDDISQLKREKLAIEQQKLALYFDELKYQIDNFTSITSMSCFSKFHKLPDSEGALFELNQYKYTREDFLIDIAPSSHYITHYDAYLHKFNQLLGGIYTDPTKHKAKSWLVQALVNDRKRTQIRDSITYLSDYIPNKLLIELSEDNHRELFKLSKFSLGFSDIAKVQIYTAYVNTTYYSVLKQALIELAKSTNTNIILINQSKSAEGGI
jgi:hypothetical protein